MRLSIASKLTTLFVVLCIPIVVLLYLLVSEKNISIDFEQKEVYGNEYLVPLRKVLENLPEHKIIQYRKKVVGNVSATALISIQDNIQHDINELDKLSKKFGTDFKLSNKKISEFKSSWSSFKNKSEGFTATQSDDRHDKLIAQLRDIIVSVGNESNLILDPDLDTFYIMDATLVKIPAISDLIFQLQSLTEKVALKKSVTAEEKTQIVVLTGLINSNLSDIKTDHETAYDNSNDKGLKAELDGNVTKNQNATKSFLSFVNDKIIGTEKINVPYTQIGDFSSKAIESSFSLWDSSLKAENKLLNERAARFNSSKVGTLTWVIILTLLLLGLGTYFITSIVNAVKQLDAGAKKVANGDLDVQVNSKTGDELESLSNSFNAMINNIRNLVQETEGAKNVAERNNLNMEALVKETTTSVTQIKQNSEIVSDNARIVAEAASLAVDISSDGEKAVSDSVEGVQRIKDQIEAVAGKILELSAQTQAISKIISTVDDIAKQSKFLAFNASIEASKAGDYGKGFAIVANEIKNLSEESKEATKRISEILNEIQDLTNTSVMLTEDASKLAEMGVSLSKVAGETIEKLSYSIQNSSEAAFQISSSSIEQKTSLEQLEESMRRIAFAGNN
ncbi:MAG: HAMP domain-containing protein [Candidatus Sericytochromatia bacterium]|nr:HAMP domain-containing protein [Candidatus Sericytochromatia bacterium]